MANYRKYSLFPKTLTDCIEPLTRPVFKAKGLAHTRLLTEWSQIVGPELAASSIPEKLSFPTGKTNDGILTISVQNGFAPQMQHMQPIILERLSTYFGYKAVSRIHISHSYKKAAATPPPAPKPAYAPKLPTSALDRISTQVDDPELQAVLESFGQALTGK